MSIGIWLTGAGVAGIGLVAATSPGWRGWAADRREAEEMKSWLAVEPGQEVFSPDMVKGLPEPAQRYLLRAIQPGTRLANSLRLAFDGTVQHGPKTRKWPLQGRDIVITPGKGFVWPEKILTGPLPRYGILYYAKETGRVCWSLWNLFRDPAKVSRKGPNTTKSLAARFASQYIWIPSALLPQRGVTWEAVDGSHARAVVRVGEETVPLTLEIDPQGRLKTVEFPRWGAKNPDGSYSYFPFGLEIEGEKTFGGYTIPAFVRAMWCFRSEDREPPLTHEYGVTTAVYL